MPKGKINLVDARIRDLPFPVGATSRQLLYGQFTIVNFIDHRDSKREIFKNEYRDFMQMEAANY